MRGKFSALALLSVLVFLSAACGDDAPSPTGNEGAGDGEEVVADAEFCDAYVQLQAAVIAASSGGDPSAVESPLEEARGSVPEELSEPAEAIFAMIDEAMKTGEGHVFESEEFSAADKEIDTFIRDNCGYEEIEVAAVDYAFEGLPATLASGNVTFTFNNEGDEVHEMLLVRLLDESLTSDDLLEMSDKEAEGKLQFFGSSFGPPGTVDSVTYPLEPGRYVVACFLPVGATSLKALEKAEGPPHAIKGMISEFTVE